MLHFLEDIAAIMHAHYTETTAQVKGHLHKFSDASHLCNFHMCRQTIQRYPSSKYGIVHILLTTLSGNTILFMCPFVPYSISCVISFTCHYYFKQYRKCNTRSNILGGGICKYSGPWFDRTWQAGGQPKATPRQLFCVVKGSHSVEAVQRRQHKRKSCFLCGVHWWRYEQHCIHWAGKGVWQHSICTGTGWS